MICDSRLSMKVTLNFIANIEHVWFFHYAFLQQIVKSSYLLICCFFVLACNAKSFAIAILFSFFFSLVLLDRMTKVFGRHSLDPYLQRVCDHWRTFLLIHRQMVSLTLWQLLFQRQVPRASLICAWDSWQLFGNC